MLQVAVVPLSLVVPCQLHAPPRFRARSDSYTHQFKANQQGGALVAPYSRSSPGDRRRSAQAV
jgi:hypothetical protein